MLKLCLSIRSYQVDVNKGKYSILKLKRMFELLMYVVVATGQLLAKTIQLKANSDLLEI